MMHDEFSSDNYLDTYRHTGIRFEFSQTVRVKQEA
jgi:hypothetical protein